MQRAQLGIEVYTQMGGKEITIYASKDRRSRKQTKAIGQQNIPSHGSRKGDYRLLVTRTPTMAGLISSGTANVHT